MLVWWYQMHGQPEGQKWLQTSDHKQEIQFPFTTDTVVVILLGLLRITVHVIRLCR